MGHHVTIFCLCIILQNYDSQTKTSKLSHTPVLWKQIQMEECVCGRSEDAEKRKWKLKNERKRNRNPETAAWNQEKGEEVNLNETTSLMATFVSLSSVCLFNLHSFISPKQRRSIYHFNLKVNNKHTKLLLPSVWCVAWSVRNAHKYIYPSYFEEKRNRNSGGKGKWVFWHPREFARLTLLNSSFTGDCVLQNIMPNKDFHRGWHVLKGAIKLWNMFHKCMTVCFHQLHEAQNIHSDLLGIMTVNYYKLKLNISISDISQGLRWEVSCIWDVSLWRKEAEIS